MIHVNWEQYFTVLGLLVIGYWILVGVTCYRKEIKEKLSGGSGLGAGGPVHLHSPFGEETAQEEQLSLFRREEVDERSTVEVREESDRFKTLYILADEVRDIIREAGILQTVRGELLQGLHSVIRKEFYQDLNAPEYRAAINNLVAVEAEERCGIHFDAAELNMLWTNRDRS